MTTADVWSEAPPLARRRGPSKAAVTFVAAIIGSLTLLIRVALHSRSFDLYGDEALYMDMGRSVMSGGFPHYEGVVFFLHGPAFFYLEAGWAHLVGNQSGLVAWVQAMRLLNGVLATATAIVLVLLVTRAASLWAGGAVGMLFALDPFIIRQNDRVLLETSMMLWVMLGYLTFSSLLDRYPSRRDWIPAVGTGFFFSCAILTKDEGALLTLLPLLAAAILRWGVRLRITLLILGTSVAVYALYAVIVAVNGLFGVFWAVKTWGIQRMLGLVQVTGFHSSGGGNLSARLTGEAKVFWSTYLILLLAVPAALVLLRRGNQLQRMLGLLYCASGVTLAYAVLFGTLEEQELYLLAIPSLVVVVVGAAALLRGQGASHAPRDRRKTPLIAFMAAAVTLTAMLNLVTCAKLFLQPDDAFLRVYQYVTSHVSAGTTVSAVNGDIDSAYTLSGRYNVGYWDTPAALAGAHARYLIVEWGPISQGYSDLSLSQVHKLVGRGRPIASFWGRTDGTVDLYKVDPSSGKVTDGIR